MPDQSHEEWALIAFINARKQGNPLRDIAERRLVDLKTQSERTLTLVPKRPTQRNAVKVINIKTNQIFESITAAAESIDIPRHWLNDDIRRKIQFYPFRLA